MNVHADVAHDAAQLHHPRRPHLAPLVCRVDRDDGLREYLGVRFVPERLDLRDHAANDERRFLSHLFRRLINDLCRLRRRRRCKQGQRPHERSC